MWITRKTDYATRAVLALAIAESGGSSLKLAELAERTAVPAPFLEQIMSQLRGAGIVRSVRGPAGGYRLNHPAAEISLDRVVRVFQGQLAPIACATRSLTGAVPDGRRLFAQGGLAGGQGGDDRDPRERRLRPSWPSGPVAAGPPRSSCCRPRAG